MKILVIDDTLAHQASARQTLGNHDLTVATSYEEGFRLLTPVASLPPPYKCCPDVRRGEKGNYYDAVLSDMLMPATDMMLSLKAKERFEGKEEALGWVLVMRAVLNGTRFAALVSDTNHHDHPAGYALDALDNADEDAYAWGDGRPTTKKPQFNINGASVGFFKSPPLRLVHGVRGCRWKCNDGKDGSGKTCGLCEGTGFAHGKDWGLVLKVLLAAAV